MQDGNNYIVCQQNDEGQIQLADQHLYPTRERAETTRARLPQKNNPIIVTGRFDDLRMVDTSEGAASQREPSTA